MSKVKIITTIDYETFGNGEGDVRECMIKPMDQMIAVANKYGVPLTLMAEMCSYEAFKKEEEAGRLPADYRPASRIREQLKACVQSGHDVQLHLHPQWTNYHYQDRWSVDLSRWKISSLSYGEMAALLKQGKEELEAMLKPVKPDYSCFVFRAGAWCIQPEKEVLGAMKAAGLKLDSSVAPNSRFESSLTEYDFRGMPDKAYWFVGHDLRKETETGILEIPIYTRSYSFQDKVYYKALRWMKNVRSQSYENTGAKRKKSFLCKFRPAATMLDFCLMSDDEMLAMVEDAARRFAHLEVIPVVAIGHSKLYDNAKNSASFIRKAFKRGYTFGTFSEVMAHV